MYVLPSDDDEGGYLNRHLQELERFPRLHSQIIEVVSDLLRERLSPTSEYAQSLIQIQAAYINTNHPAFVTGSAQAQGAEGTQVKPQRKRVGFFLGIHTVYLTTLMHFPAAQGDRRAQRLLVTGR